MQNGALLTGIQMPPLPLGLMIVSLNSLLKTRFRISFDPLSETTLKSFGPELSYVAFTIISASPVSWEPAVDEVANPNPLEVQQRIKSGRSDGRRSALRTLLADCGPKSICPLKSALDAPPALRARSFPHTSTPKFECAYGGEPVNPWCEQDSFRSRNAQRYLRYLSIGSANNEDLGDDPRTN
jgi:hypothetical protein